MIEDAASPPCWRVRGRDSRHLRWATSRRCCRTRLKPPSVGRPHQPGGAFATRHRVASRASQRMVRGSELRFQGLGSGLGNSSCGGRFSAPVASVTVIGTASSNAPSILVVSA